MLDPTSALGAAEAVEEAVRTAPIHVLAVVQGLTEFLPVSSSGHLVLGSAVLGVEPGEGLLQAVALHFGTLLAVVAVYFPELERLLADARRGRPRMLLLLAVGTLPAVVAGLWIQSSLEEIFDDPTVAACGLLVTTALLLWGEGGRRATTASLPPGVVPPDRALRVADALWIGLSQALAIVPGISRSGATIATGMRLGLSGAQAARFSFLLSVPAIAGASLLTGVEAWREGVEGVTWTELLVGTALAAVVGWLALRGLLALLSRGVFPWFALYTGLLGSGWLLFG